MKNVDFFRIKGEDTLFFEFSTIKKMDIFIIVSWKYINYFALFKFNYTLSNFPISQIPEKVIDLSLV